MNRKTVADLQASRLPQAVGLCRTDEDALFSLVNEAQESLVKCGGETGWYGTWAKVAFNVSQSEPNFTLPREIARAINLVGCRRPLKIQNEFYEFLDFGIGLQPQTSCSTVGGQAQCGGFPETYDRGMVVSFGDLEPPGKTLRFYATDADDYGKRVLVQGKDASGNVIYSTDGEVQVQGIFLELATPFVDLPFEISELAGIQKDVTKGNVLMYQVDSATAAQTLMSTYAPRETIPVYRRYFINGLPKNCCVASTDLDTVQIVAMCKLELIPVAVSTDYLLIGNLRALKAEMLSCLFEERDNTAAVRLAGVHHKRATSLLNQELAHYLGRERPAMQLKPWGNSTLEKQGIGTLI